MITVTRLSRMSFVVLLAAGVVGLVSVSKAEEPNSAAAPQAAAPAQPGAAAPAAAARATPAAPVSLAQIKSDLAEAKAQILATTAALNKLQGSATSDVVANYNAYEEEYLKLQTKAEQVRSRAAGLKTRGEAYLAMWTKQTNVDNPMLRGEAVTQKTEAQTLVGTIANEMEMTRIEFAPFMANLTDVGDYLYDNLTPANLMSTSTLISKANEQAAVVNTHIDALITSVDQMAVATGAAQPAPGTAQPASEVQPPSR